MVIWKVSIRDVPCLNQTELSFPLPSFPACKQNKRKRLIVKLCRNNENMTTTGGKWSWITVTSDGRSSWLLQVVNIGGTKDDVRDVVRTFGSTVCSLQHDHKKTKYAFCIVLLLWRSCSQVWSHNTWALQNSKVVESVTDRFDTSRFDKNLSSKITCSLPE